MRSVFEEQGAGCRLVAPFCHVDRRSIGRVDVRHLVRPRSTEIVRLENFRGLEIVSLDQAWRACDPDDPDRMAEVVEVMGAKEYPKSEMTRALPYALTRAARDSPPP